MQKKTTFLSGLCRFESTLILPGLTPRNRKTAPAPNPAEDSGQVSLGDMTGAAVLDELRMTAVDTLTPIKALNLLYRLKQRL